MTVTTPAPTAREATRWARLRSWQRATAAVATVVVVAVATVGVGFVLLGRDQTPSAAPYRDAAAAGRLTLCQAGKAVTSGSLAGASFTSVVGGAVSDQPADAGGLTATVYGYQPREGAEVSEWTGIPLTAPAPITGSGPAVAQVGSDGVSLAQFLGGYPATWDGWVQLRLLISSTTEGLLSSYASLDLNVSGEDWTAVAPGDATCSA